MRGATFLGLDLGTSALKAVLLSDDGRGAGQASHGLSLERPRPLWSEQNPADWWLAVEAVMAALRERWPDALSAVGGIGLTGQMHGAVLLDASMSPLRPAILWNDGRAHLECAELETRVPDLMRITGNIAMPGFTAPKLLWVARHEPEVFRQARLVLLPKDYLRLRLTGDAASDMSDASGTLWLDVGGRAWSDDMIHATGLTRAHMPGLHEGPEITGRLRPDLARAWGMAEAPVVAGAGDNAAAALGLGVTGAGTGFLSLGTSGVYFLPKAEYRPQPAKAIHTFCHALPGLWHAMAVTLSAGDALVWLSEVMNAPPGSLLAEAETAGPAADRGLFFTPYLSGERSPHNDPFASASFKGLRRHHTRGDIARAVLEGVALSLADASEPATSGAPAHSLILTGGGARSAIWRQLICDALGMPVIVSEDPEVGPAQGAARLARAALMGLGLEGFPAAPGLELAPLGDLRRHLADYRGLYPGAKPPPPMSASEGAAV